MGASSSQRRYHTRATDLPADVSCSHDGCKFGHICGVNGKVVAVPDCAEKILVFDPVAGNAEAVDLPACISSTGENKFRTSCVVNGKVVVVPCCAEKILLIEDLACTPAMSLNLHLGSACTENLPDLLAAALSLWIYTDDPEPPSPPRTSMTVLRIIQRPKLGAVKVALVSATCPEGRMMLVVFKGTSCILDFLNWNLEHDHTMTKDEAFFVHRGAAGTMGNLQFWLDRFHAPPRVRMQARRGSGGFCRTFSWGHV